MDKESISREFIRIGITSTHGLYNFINNHSSTRLFDKQYNLDDSHDAMMFMSLYLECLDYDFKRFMFVCHNGEEIRHFFVVFSDESKWFYYDALMEELSGMYVFDDYTTMIDSLYCNFVFYFRCFDGNFNLLEISSDDDFCGMEIMNSYNDKAPSLSKYLEIGEAVKIKRRKSGGDKGAFYLFISFIGTLFIIFVLFWIVFTFILNK